MKQRKILVTGALPYANGDIHLGHVMEAIQTDIWVRLQKMRGHQCIYVCADDAHGTAIMLSAESQGITPEELIDRVNREHRRDYVGFLIGFDNFYTTHSEENRELSESIYLALERNGHIARRNIRQLFDPEKNLFLADRYITGACPRCNAEGQYGDNCEVCGSTHSPSELIDPKSALSGATPVEKESEHFFFTVSAFTEMLRNWIRGGAVHEAVANKLDEWLEEGLQDWDISRDAPYFGFEIPGHPGKYFYVWLDAPIGYMASFLNYCKRKGLDFDAWWQSGRDHELYHFIGKDIVNFHTLFWPAMLESAGYRTPDAVFVHGFLTVDGTKMSKSRGTFINAETYLKHLSPEYLRYYLAAKLGPGVDDLDLNLEDFVQRVNSDLVGKLVNIASRCAGFIGKNFDGMLADAVDNEALIEEVRDASAEIADLFEQREYGKAVRRIMALADKANQYLNERKPWEIAKSDQRSPELQQICTTGINAFRLLAGYLKPVLPAMAADAEEFLAIDPLAWSDFDSLLLDHRINRFKPLMTRVEPAAVQAMIEESRQSWDSGQNAAEAAPAEEAIEEIAAEIDIDAFAKVDLRVAQVIEASLVEGADKLLRLRLDLGVDAAGDPVERTVFAGIRTAYKPEQLTDKLLVVVANLKPRKMKFGTSEGMILAAGPGGKEIWVLHPDTGAKPGMRIN
ncbi:MAG: methionine--tRNA ligase [Gammaproteobacteria bacterium]|nr:methionine--tRNA ligase [Gammaproteobacteria bacterium]MYH45768.1 methionine--tRNA ligase [Gammaproteobacteria bacterium]MYL12718.1 methionine--tRNA ligase [Gammaproteobacteria bacterium]